MPELSEVEIMTRNVERWVGGRSLVGLVDVDQGLFGSDQQRASACALKGVAFGRVWRRGKYLCVEIDDGVLVIHCRMAGKVVRSAGPRRYTRARLVVDDGVEVLLVDSRRLSNAWFMRRERVNELFEKLGPEPWPMKRDGMWWKQRLAGLSGAIKPALMRQDRVAGVGNILATEICFVARVDPRSPVPTISEVQWGRLAEAVHQCIDSVIENESGPEIMYVNQGGPSHFLVYGRSGQSCEVCGSIIERFKQHGRSTFWCAGCQKL